MATPTWAEFYISDGTTEIDMLDYFYLFNWRPRITQYKDGGVYRDSPLSDGRTLAYRRYENVGETIQFHARAVNPDNLAGALRRIRNLLEDAGSYWFTSFQERFVYIGARAQGESKTRYCLLVAATIPEDDDPYSSEVYDVEYVLAKGLTLAIERLPFWTLEVPTQATAVKMYGYSRFGLVEFGNVDDTGAIVPTSDPEVYIRNGYNMANLTHIFIDDGGAFSSNQIAEDVPYPLLPAAPAEDDAVYFGCQTSVDDSGPFFNIVFDIGTAIADVTIVWEYWDGGSWATLDTTPAVFWTLDNTGGFANTGVNGIFISNISDWEETAVNSITAFWIRARVSAIGASPTPPYQQNRKPYSVTWPSIEIQSDQILGDVPAIMRLKMLNKSCADIDRYPQLFADHIIVGARSVERGANFIPYINVANVQNQSGITVSAVESASFQAEVEFSATGIVGRWAPGAAVDDPETAFTIEMDSTIATQYTGRYHAYLRVQLNSGFPPADVLAGLRVSAFATASNLYYDTELQPCRIVGFDPVLLDMGRISLPPGGTKPGETITKIVFTILAKSAIAAGCSLDFYDLILMPTDEWYGDYEEVAILTDTNILHAENYLDIDGITYPRNPYYAPVRTLATDDLEVTYRSTTITPPQIRPGAAVRLHFLFERSESWLTVTKFSTPQICFAAQLFVSQRFLSSIGDGVNV